MPSEKPPVTVRFQDEKNKSKLQRIADLNGRSTSREAERILVRYIKNWEEAYGEIKLDK